MNHAQFLEPYLRLALHLERRPLKEKDKEALMESWYDLVRDIRVEVWREVVNRLLRQSQFMPTPAEALELVEPVALDLHLAQIQQAYVLETERRQALGAPDHNPRAREIVDAIRHFKRLIADQENDRG